MPEFVFENLRVKISAAMVCESVRYSLPKGGMVVLIYPYKGAQIIVRERVVLF